MNQRSLLWLAAQTLYLEFNFFQAWLLNSERDQGTVASHYRSVALVLNILFMAGLKAADWIREMMEGELELIGY